MDFLAMVEDRLSFIERFYNRTAEPFEVIQRKIETEEEPFVPRRAPEQYDEPEYLDEWQEADDILRVLGHCGLGLVGKALQDYLRGFIMREAEVSTEADFSQTMRQCQGDGWLRKYFFFLEQNTRFDWSRSPVPFERIEQINLSRNDVTHDPRIDSVRAHRTEKHFSKYPVPSFADELEILALGGEDEPPLIIKVTRQNLANAIEDVRRFCSFVESERTK
jgi:hypothetical protein